MLKCEIVKDLLPLYLDGCCSEVSKQEIEEHLKNCGDCQRAAKEMGIELEVSEEERLQNISSKEILKEGEKMLEKKIKRNFLGKAAYIDFILNFALFIYDIFILTGSWVEMEAEEINMKLQAAQFQSDALRNFAMCLFPVIPCLLIGEFVFIINHNFRGKDTLTSRIITMMSVYVKIVVVVVMVVLWTIRLFV